MDNRKKFRVPYLAILSIGFLSTIAIAADRGFKIQELAWMFWASSALMAPIVLVLGQIERLVSKDPAETKARKYFSVAISIAFGGFGIYMVHGIIGAFLSIVARIDPDFYFGPNGYINNIDIRAFQILFEKYGMLFPAYLAVKSSAGIVTPSARFAGHGVVRDSILALISVFLVSLVGYGLIGRYSSNEIRTIEIVLFCAFFFSPWSLIVARDIHAKARDRVADLDPAAKLPVNFIDQGSKFWGTAVALFGSVFLMLGIWFPFFMLEKYGFTISAVFFLSLFVVAFCGFGLLAIFIGLTMSFAYRKIVIQAGTVECEEKSFRPLPVTRKWRESLTEFDLRADKVHHDSSDSASYYEYKVELVHNSSKDRNVTLYRAYHEQDWTTRAAQWKKALAKD